MKIFDFNEQLIEGQETERFLDSIFSKFVRIQDVEMDLQTKGVDRIFYWDDMAIAVEYKADRRATITGNAFIEIISVSHTNKAGWAKTTNADWIIYFLPQEMKAYVVRVKEMRQKLDEWLNTYPTGTAQNEEYQSIGILVPLTELEKCGKIMCL